MTIHQHLDGNVSIRYGPHVVGRYIATGEIRPAGVKQPSESRGKGGPVETVENQKQVSPVPTAPWKYPATPAGFPLSHRSGYGFPLPDKDPKTPVRKPTRFRGSNQSTLPAVGLTR